ncbi:1-(5-phosphoribosyl)-5-[(5-phosphoribosylamino)methylideneamino] imidazole-4-carboxamide isomerase [Pseudomonas sp. FW306-02-F02-AA]|uniref:Transposase n=1 Tax=Pseudomonas fluorescens TaxID=294 RepID=A0A0N9WFR1_PSEFL|nr:MULTISPECIES: 3-keto-5-aminohexanoate cleavage protein [Pseudomonas]ALI03425.1 transposase [Pseudomonas fluorescens]PMZ03549.1 1-(5-phosphoribosyl)-5-[(5-phosphoribosylamino)methylideneamino] imidazole-4-carboxamide isomerase [Pseudomonas sp. FW306-02-F02-AB]PMZ09704.1 1-(5-phosphoribosyl)-5-[(5-phosphoribosylamino)methylideneamino] imidazole-4-carboxamide isomerase [Pseudomonas sp. FW306-02-H06C]PMZ15443.1 1-(5-phosphoribosyl)-5-[(5-phosphoribosylamino)methylideneamino] imidazole-4-carboxam
MQFFDDSLHPENMEKVVITVAPYGPEWMPEDFPEDIPLTMDEQVQKAVDCYEAGATVLHLHVRELDGKGSKRLSKFNELIAGVREAVPDMIIQVGGSISFAPESDGEAAKWLSDDTRHMLADLTPKPDQVTVAINTTQMNIMELLYPEYLEGTSLANPAYQAAYSEMTVPAGPAWVAEHLRRLMAAGVQPHFQLTGMHAMETLERLVRKGVYMGPLNLTWIGIGGGFDGPNPFNFFNFVHRAPDGCTLTAESLLKNVLPFNVMALSMGLHPRVGIEDTIIDQKGRRFSSVQQIEQTVRVAHELGREIASGKEAREIYRIGVQYQSIEETLLANGMAPNRKAGQKGVPQRG